MGRIGSDLWAGLVVGILTLTAQGALSIPVQDAAVLSCDDSSIQKVLRRWTSGREGAREQQEALLRWRQRVSAHLLEESLGVAESFHAASWPGHMWPPPRFPSPRECPALQEAAAGKDWARWQKQWALQQRRWQALTRVPPEVQERQASLIAGAVWDIAFLHSFFLSDDWRQAGQVRVRQDVPLPPLFASQVELRDANERVQELFQLFPMLSRSYRHIVGFPVEIVWQKLAKIIFDSKALDRAYWRQQVESALAHVPKTHCQGPEFTALNIQVPSASHPGRLVTLNSEETCYILRLQAIMRGPIPLQRAREVMARIGGPNSVIILRSVADVLGSQARDARGQLLLTRKALCHGDVSVLEYNPQGLSRVLEKTTDKDQVTEAVSLMCSGQWLRSPQKDFASGLNISGLGLFAASAAVAPWFPPAAAVTLPAAATFVTASALMSYNRDAYGMLHGQTLNNPQFAEFDGLGQYRRLLVVKNGLTLMQIPLIWQGATSLAAQSIAAGSGQRVSFKLGTWLVEMSRINRRQALIFLSGFGFGRYLEVSQYIRRGINPFTDRIFWLNTAQDLVADVLMAKFYGQAEGVKEVIQAGGLSAIASLFVNHLAQDLSYFWDGETISPRSLLFDVSWGLGPAPITEMIFFGTETLLERMVSSAPHAAWRHAAMQILPVIMTILEHAIEESRASGAKLRYMRDGDGWVDAVLSLEHFFEDLRLDLRQEKADEYPLGKRPKLSSDQLDSMIRIVRSWQQTPGSEQTLSWLDQLFTMQDIIMHRVKENDDSTL